MISKNLGGKLLNFQNYHFPRFPKFIILTFAAKSGFRNYKMFLWLTHFKIFSKNFQWGKLLKFDMRLFIHPSCFLVQSLLPISHLFLFLNAKNPNYGPEIPTNISTNFSGNFTDLTRKLNPSAQKPCKHWKKLHTPQCHSLRADKPSRIG